MINRKSHNKQPIISTVFHFQPTHLMVQVLESRSFDFNISGALMAFPLRSFFQFIVFKVIKVHVDKQLHFLVCDFLINIIKDRTVGASKGRGECILQGRVAKGFVETRLTEAITPFFTLGCRSNLSCVSYLLSLTPLLMH